MDKFLLAENPMRPENSGLWIIHLLTPQAIIRCIEGRIDMGNSVHAKFEYRNSDGVLEEWTLGIYYCAQFDGDLMPLLNRAWRWYRSYMAWEDGNIDINEEASNN